MFSSIPKNWSVYSIGREIAEYTKKTTIEDEFEVFTSSKAGLVPQAEYYSGENRITRRSNIGFNVIPKGHLTYRSRSDNNKFTFNQNTTGVDGCVSKYYPVFTSRHEIETNTFLVFLFNYYSDWLARESVGTSQLVLAFSAIKRSKLPFPPLPEQKRIATILTSVDTVIEKTQAQIDKLNDLKTGMMQEPVSYTHLTLPTKA